MRCELYLAHPHPRTKEAHTRLYGRYTPFNSNSQTGVGIPRARWTLKNMYLLFSSTI
jgi:hypothetical protein